MVSVALNGPTEGGPKTTTYVWMLLGGMMSGPSLVVEGKVVGLSPVTGNTLLSVAIELIVRGTHGLVLPMTTRLPIHSFGRQAPNTIGSSDTERCCGGVGVAVPLRGMTRVGVTGSLLLIVTATPVTGPTPVGLNTTVTGNCRDPVGRLPFVGVTVKGGAVEMEEMSSCAVPMFCSWKVREALSQNATAPKSRDLTVATIFDLPGGGGGGPEPANSPSVIVAIELMPPFTVPRSDGLTPATLNRAMFSPLIAPATT